MKKLLPVLVVAAFISGAAVLHFYLRASSPLYNLFVPPNDLYSSSVESYFDLTQANFETELEVIHKYPGRYMVALAVERPASYGTVYESDFLIYVSARSSELTLLEDTFPSPNNSFQGGDWGFLPLVIYSVPDQAPRQEPTSFRVTLVKADSDFSAKYGRTRIYIGKLSDE